MRRRIALAAAAVALLLSLSAPAAADPISPAAYVQGIAAVRDEASAARRAGGTERARLLARARADLVSLREVRVGESVYRVPYANVLALLSDDDASLARAVGTLDAMADAISASAGRPPLDPRQSRGLLDGVLASSEFAPATPGWGDALLGLLRDALAALFPELRAPQISLLQISIVLGALAIALAGIVLSSVARGVRERVARGDVDGPAPAGAPERPSDHLAAADAARLRGDRREAMRELLLFVLLSIEQRGMLRYDPALTDGEVVARAASLAVSADLERLVRIHERVRYGLYDLRPDEMDAAVSLARRIAA